MVGKYLNVSPSIPYEFEISSLGQYAAGEPSSTNAWGSAMGGVIQNGIPPAGRGRGMLDPSFMAANGSIGGASNDPTRMPMGRGLSIGPSVGL